MPWIPGYDVAGIVDRAGPGTEELLGQRVVAMTGFPLQGGGYAEFVVAAASHVAPLADSVSFTAAAATPLAGGTAWEILERLRLGQDDNLLVLGASGGVGSCLVQLAALQRIAPVAVGRRAHHERLRQLGARCCIDYTDPHGPELLRRSGYGSVDALADLVGGNAAGPWVDMLREHGQIAAIETPELDLDRLVDANLTFHGILVSTSGQRTRKLADLLADDRLTPHVPHLLPLAQAAQAHRLLESRHAGGKVVLTTSAGS